MYEQNEAHQQWLEAFIRELDAFAGTVHVQRGQDLYLTAAHNIPPHVVPKRLMQPFHHAVLVGGKHLPPHAFPARLSHLASAGMLPGTAEF